MDAKQDIPLSAVPREKNSGDSGFCLLLFMVSENTNNLMGRSKNWVRYCLSGHSPRELRRVQTVGNMTRLLLQDGQGGFTSSPQETPINPWVNGGKDPGAGKGWGMAQLIRTMTGGTLNLLKSDIEVLKH